MGDVKRTNRTTGMPRGSNFTAREVSLLADVVTRFIDIVENKKTDGVMMQVKQANEMGIAGIN